MGHGMPCLLDRMQMHVSLSLELRCIDHRGCGKGMLGLIWGGKASLCDSRRGERASSALQFWLEAVRGRWGTRAIGES